MYRNIAVCFFILLVVIVSTSNLHSQIKGLSGMSGDELLKMELESQFSDDVMRSESMPVGNIIDPELYFLGPEDILTIQIVPIMSNPRSIRLSPDMSIMIPRVGKIDMRGLTLRQAQDSIESFFKSYNPNYKVFTNLREARKCIVKIAGNVLYPSIYTVPSSYQVSTAILFANQLQKNTAIALPQMEALLQVQEAARETERRFSESGLSTKPFYSSRNIILLRKDGS
jgi:protein involved in polysaccharide export with SLBB domain